MTDYAADFDSLAGSKPAAAKDYASDFESLAAEPSKTELAATKPTQSAFGAANPVGEVAANVVTGLGSSIIGGYHGLWKLATGQGLDAAAEAVRADQARGTYQAEPGSPGAKATEAFQSGYNPLNWPSLASHWLGEKAYEAGAGPGIATGIEVAGNALPLAFLRGGRGAPAAARAEPRGLPEGAPALTGGERGATPTVAPATAVKPVEFTTADPAEALAAGGKALNPADLQGRSAILERVGIPKEQQRNSAVQGDLAGGNVDFRLTKEVSPQGDFWREQFGKERTALTNHAEQIVHDTGGSIALDEAAKYSQGQRILEPLQALKDSFDARIGDLYKQAADRAGGSPIELTSFRDALGKNSDFATTERMALRRGIKSYLKEQNLLADDGSIWPMTVQEAEQLRQYINSQYSHQTSGLAGKLKNQIDESVMSSAGEDVYAQARALRAARARALDDPKGIASLLEVDPNAPMNRAIPIEKISDRVQAMPVAQLQHIVNLLKTAPEELQPVARAGLGEIQASFANKALELGGKRAAGEPWGANDVSKFLKDNQQKINTVYADRPDLLGKLKDLNDAGNILQPKTAYAGAPIETHNLLQRGAIYAIQPVTTAAGVSIGGMLGMPGIGGAAGSLAGGKLVGKISQQQALKNARQRVGTALGDIKP